MSRAHTEATTDHARKQDLGRAVLEILDNHESLSLNRLDSYLEQAVPDLRSHEFADTVGRLKALELVEETDAGYAFIYSITNQGIVVLETKYRGE
ncbi:hypothetical protein ACKVMT_05290 [Halobacteriales archaeon Cl-PHB]